MRILFELLLLAFPVAGIIIIVRTFFRGSAEKKTENIINLKK